MQNNSEHKSGAFKKFLKDKGYYIVLALCVVAVGVSGYLFVSTANQSRQAAQAVNESLSVPLTPAAGESQTPATSKPGAVTNKPSGSAAETAGPADEAETGTVPSAIVTVRPLDGDTIGAFSMDALRFNATTQDWRTHNGIDIAAAVGTNVCVVRDGTVTGVYEDDAFGKTVVVSHGDGYVTHYANLAAEVPVSVGQTVTAGDVLGTVGETATVETAENSHLHFTVFHNNEPLDPEQFLG